MIEMEPSKEEMVALWRRCNEFVEKQRISCPETIYQTDWIIENAYEFIEQICNVVGYYEYPED